MTMESYWDNAVSNSGSRVLAVTQWWLDSTVYHVPDAIYYDWASNRFGTLVTMLYSKMFFLKVTWSTCLHLIIVKLQLIIHDWPDTEALTIRSLQCAQGNGSPQPPPYPYVYSFLYSRTILQTVDTDDYVVGSPNCGRVWSCCRKHRNWCSCSHLLSSLYFLIIPGPVCRLLNWCHLALEQEMP